MRNGVRVEVRRENEKVWEIVRLFDFDEPANNDWLVVNQFTVIEACEKPRRPDIVIFVNGIPIALIELKKRSDKTTRATANNALVMFPLS